MKKIMEFFFGKKYPIFNKQGEIEHSRKKFFKEWKLAYKEDLTKNWNHHKGMIFKSKTTKK